MEQLRSSRTTVALPKSRLENKTSSITASCDIGSTATFHDWCTKHVSCNGCTDGQIQYQTVREYLTEPVQECFGSRNSVSSDAYVTSCLSTKWRSQWDMGKPVDPGFRLNWYFERSPSSKGQRHHRFLIMMMMMMWYLFTAIWFPPRGNNTKPIQKHRIHKTENKISKKKIY